MVDNGSINSAICLSAALSALDRRVRIHLLTTTRGSRRPQSGTALARGAMIGGSTATPSCRQAHRRVDRHAADAHVGVAGGDLQAGNEAEIDVPYRLRRTAASRRHRARRRRAIRDSHRHHVLRGAAARRLRDHRAVGRALRIGLFERYYSMQVRQAGLQVVCARDAFVHHFGQASIGRLWPADGRPALSCDRQRWEAGWGIMAAYERRDKSDTAISSNRSAASCATRRHTIRRSSSSARDRFLEPAAAAALQDEDGTCAG